MFAIPESLTYPRYLHSLLQSNAVTAAFRYLCREAPGLHSVGVQMMTGEGVPFVSALSQTLVDGVRFSTSRDFLVSNKPCLLISQTGHLMNNACRDRPPTSREPNPQRTSSAPPKEIWGSVDQVRGSMGAAVNPLFLRKCGFSHKAVPICDHGSYNEAAKGYALACSAHVVLQWTRLFRRIDQLQAVCKCMLYPAGCMHASRESNRIKPFHLSM